MFTLVCISPGLISELIYLYGLVALPAVRRYPWWHLLAVPGHFSVSLLLMPLADPNSPELMSLFVMLSPLSIGMIYVQFKTWKQWQQGNGLPTWGTVASIVLAGLLVAVAFWSRATLV